MNRVVLSTLVLSILLLVSQRTWAAAGDLDPTFGNGGVVMQSELGMSELDALALQADGKVVAAGTSDAGLTLARYNSDGSLDATFGSGGLVTTSQVNVGMRLVLQPDGKPVAAGATADSGVHFAVVRYNTDGSLDATFGTGGVASLPTFSDSDFLWALALQPDGKVIAAGSGSSSEGGIVLARLNTDGTLDQGFGGRGWVATRISKYDGAKTAAIQPDGQIVVGDYSCSENDCRWVVVRYNANGELDQGFGNRGVAAAAPMPLGDLNALLLRPDGKIVVAGSALGQNAGFAAMRFTKDGVLDTAFGSGGVALAPGPGAAEALAGRPDGSLLLGGYFVSEVPDGSSGTFVVARFTDAGVLDREFGHNGIAITDVTPGFDLVLALVGQADSKFVAGGAGTRPLGGRVWALARFADVPCGNDCDTGNVAGVSQPHGVSFSLDSVKPVRARIARGAISATKSVRVRVRTTTPDPTQTVTIAAQDGTCPSGTAGQPTPSVITLARRRTTVSLPLVVRSAAFQTRSRNSPARCTAAVTAALTNGGQQTIQVVVDVTDSNDL